MTSPERPVIQAWNPAGDPPAPEINADDVVATMTDILDREHPLPTKINKAAYTENLTTS